MGFSSRLASMGDHFVIIGVCRSLQLLVVTYQTNTEIHAASMCYQRHKTPVSYPDCVGKSSGNCTKFDPEHDRVDWCPPAQRRGTRCPVLTPTSQASSTKRKMNCPNHKNGQNLAPKKDDEGPSGSSGGSLTASSVKVGA